MVLKVCEKTLHSITYSQKHSQHAKASSETLLDDVINFLRSLNGPTGNLSPDLIPSELGQMQESKLDSSACITCLQ